MRKGAAGEPMEQAAGAQQLSGAHVGNRSIEASCILGGRLAAASCT